MVALEALEMMDLPDLRESLVPMVALDVQEKL